MPRAGKTAVAPPERPRAPSPAAPAVHGTQRANRTVTVACKLPNGYILQLCKKTTYWEDTPSGAKERIRFDRIGDQVIVAGPAYPVQPPRGYPKPIQQEGGYALTRGIDAAFWEQWLEQNKANPVVTSGAIFAQPTMESITAEAREHEKFKTGFEPLDVSDDGKHEHRIPRPPMPGISLFKYQPEN